MKIEELKEAVDTALNEWDGWNYTVEEMQLALKKATLEADREAIRAELNDAIAMAEFAHQQWAAADNAYQSKTLTES